MERKHKGAHSELVACAWLLRRGYEVFRNVSQHGRYDMIAIKGTKVAYIDVKTCHPDAKGHLRRTAPPPGIIYLLIGPDGRCEPLPADTL